jgi:hypothetical protein
VVEGTSLLRKHTGLNLYRGFESLALRQKIQALFLKGFFCIEGMRTLVFGEQALLVSNIGGNNCFCQLLPELNLIHKAHLVIQVFTLPHDNPRHGRYQPITGLSYQPIA